jgi:predicted nucleic acid-binding protein
MLIPSGRTDCGINTSFAAAPPRRPIADVLIASFAGRFQGIVTRNANDFRQIDPSLTLVEP